MLFKICINFVKLRLHIEPNDASGIFVLFVVEANICMFKHVNKKSNKLKPCDKRFFKAGTF
jgi:hypothetical protein